MTTKRPRKARVCITLDPEQWERLQQAAEAMEGENVSSLIERCVRRALTAIKLEEVPRSVERLEELQFRLEEMKRARVKEIMEGRYDREMEDEIAEVQHKIDEIMAEAEIQRLIEARDSGKGTSQGKEKSKDGKRK